MSLYLANDQKSLQLLIKTIQYAYIPRGVMLTAKEYPKNEKMYIETTYSIVAYCLIGLLIVKDLILVANYARRCYRKTIELRDRRHRKKRLERYLRSQVEVTEVDLEPQSCSICLDSDSHNMVRLQCRHEFHRTCLLEWLSLKQQCPLCLRIVSI